MSETFEPIINTNNDNDNEVVQFTDPFFQKLEEQENQSFNEDNNVPNQNDDTDEGNDNEEVVGNTCNEKKYDELETFPETPAEIGDDTCSAPKSDDTEVLSSGQVMNAIGDLSSKLDALNELFAKRIAKTEAEDKVIDQMHKELQTYKDDIYIKLIKPVLVDISTMRNSMLQLCDFYSKKDETNIPLDQFETYTDDLKEILEKNTVVVYKSNVGDRFDPHRQKMVKRLTTPVEELDKTVASITGEGCEYNGQVICFENVEVYFYKKPIEEGE